VDDDAFEFDDRRVLAEGSVRLHAALTALGTANVPAAAALCNSLSEWYELQDLQLARALTAPTASLDWHLVRIGPAGEPLSAGMDALMIAPSLARAFGGLQIEMDRERVFPDEVRWTEHGISVLGRGDGLIASIEPVPIEAPDLQKRERVNDLMKGLRIYGDEERFIKRLSSLPGFQALQNDDQLRNKSEPSGAMAVVSVNNQCVAMRRMLKEDHGIDVAQHEAQALVAVTFGAPDWAQYIAKRDTAPAALLPATIMHWDEDAPVTEARVVLYPTVAEAVFAFAQFCRHRAPPLFPVFSGIGRTGYAYGPWLQANDDPLEPGSRERRSLPHQCSHLSLLQGDAKAEMRARTLLSDPAAFSDRAQKLFASTGSREDRLRASNRRQGIESSQELFLGDWLFTAESRGESRENRYLHIERFRGHFREVSERVPIYKTVCVREATGGWSIVSDYGRKDVAVLEGIPEREVHRMAMKFGLVCTSRNESGRPAIDVSN
jgi:hypothetical protein